jgi:hypothetical protein
MGWKDNFRTELMAELHRATQSGASYVEINSGKLHRSVGGYPGHSHRMPICCDALYEEQRAGDVVVSRPPKGKGASLTIRYKLPRSTR